MKISGFKIFLAIVAIILVILAIVPVYINPIAQRMIEKNVYPIFENRLKIGTVNISLLLWMVELKDIELRQPEDFGDGAMFKAASIKGYFSAIPVLDNQLSLRDISVINPEFTLILTRDEKINTDYVITSESSAADTKQSTAVGFVDKARYARADFQPIAFQTCGFTPCKHRPARERQVPPVRGLFGLPEGLFWRTAGGKNRSIDGIADIPGRKKRPLVFLPFILIQDVQHVVADIIVAAL